MVSASRVRQLEAITGLLPPTAIHALEIRLAPGAPRVDLSAGLANRTAARLPDPARWPEHVRWLLEQWAAADPAFAAIEAIWLELDLATTVGGAPQPIVCAKLSTDFEVDWLIGTLFPRLSGRPLSDGQDDLVRHCLNAVPTGGRLLYAFSLHPRSPAAIRLELYGLDPPAMVQYLERIATADYGHQVNRIAQVLADCDRFHLSFDLDDAVGPRIGIEGGFRRLPHREPGWRRLFDRLVHAGLCQPEKRDAVFDWPGYDTRLSCRGQWPESAAPNDYCVRSLSHVKLVTWPDREPEAKVYLLFQHLPQRPESQRPATGSARSTLR